MKKFFTCLLLITFLMPATVSAGIRSATEQAPSMPISLGEQTKKLQELYKELPDLTNERAVTEYLKKRLEFVAPANMTIEEASVASSTSVVDVAEIAKQNDAAISAYEKIYQESLKRAENSSVPLNQNDELDGTFYRIVEESTQMHPLVPDFPYVTIKLSDEREILAPAEEHIAYLLTSINIEPTGLMRVSEEFVFVSNNIGFPQGFFRILPKYGVSRDGKKRRLDVKLDKVTVNDEEYPYKITEIGDHLHIEPVKPLNLPTGIYTYRFNYLIDRAVWFHNDFDEFYWDVTARTIKNVIGSANAVVILPTGKTFLAQNAIVSTSHGLDMRRVTITSISLNSLGFADTEALAVGDDIHLYITLEKDVIVEPDFTQKFMGMIQDYGAVIFAFLAFLAMFVSYRVSDLQMRRNKDKTRASLKRTPALFRLINANVFDLRSLGAEILNLAAKNIIEIQKSDKGIVLIKKTDNLKTLSRSEQTLMKNLFPETATSLPATAESRLKIKRAAASLRRAVHQALGIYKLKLNGLYLVFSISMLLCGIIAASAIAVNPTHTFWVITSIALIITPFIVLLASRFQNKWINITAKLITAVITLYLAGVMAIYTSDIYAAIITASVYLIIWYFRRFSERSGLLRAKIKETEDFKNYLMKNPELEEKKRDFNTKKPYIFAFGLENKYQDTEDFRLITAFLTELKSENKGTK